MSSRFILTFLRVSVTILYYFLVVVFIIFLISTVVGLITHDEHAATLTGNSYKYEVRDFQKGAVEFPYTYTADSVVRYHGLRNHFSVEVKPASGMGYYLMVMKVVFFLFGIAILWNFKRIFKQVNLRNPFNEVITRRLTVLAALFIFSDVVRLADYLVFNRLLRQHVLSGRFELATTLGDGMITGLIIYLIVVIFRHGISLQEENALTV